jgi:uncharacterized LabA/DUF88 family protein
MPTEPTTKRAVAFFDGQNLFHAAKQAFGYSVPNYDPKALASAVCAGKRWTLVEARFYTGIPDAMQDARWHAFWTAKLRSMAAQGVHVFSRPLRYRKRAVDLPDGSTFEFTAGQEKGIDVRLALDVVSSARRDEFDVAIVFSQDQDLSEVADEIRAIATDRGRWIKIASAFPCCALPASRRGIDKTDWIRIDRATYDTCLDTRDYSRGHHAR